MRNNLRQFIQDPKKVAGIFKDPKKVAGIFGAVTGGMALVKAASGLFARSNEAQKALEEAKALSERIDDLSKRKELGEDFLKELININENIASSKVLSEKDKKSLADKFEKVEVAVKKAEENALSERIKDLSTGKEDGVTFDQKANKIVSDIEGSKVLSKEQKEELIAAANAAAGKSKYSKLSRKGYGFLAFIFGTLDTVSLFSLLSPLSLIGFYYLKPSFYNTIIDKLHSLTGYSALTNLIIAVAAVIVTSIALRIIFNKLFRVCHNKYLTTGNVAKAKEIIEKNIALLGKLYKISNINDLEKRYDKVLNQINKFDFSDDVKAELKASLDLANNNALSIITIKKNIALLGKLRQKSNPSDLEQLYNHVLNQINQVDFSDDVKTKLKNSLGAAKDKALTAPMPGFLGRLEGIILEQKPGLNKKANSVPAPESDKFSGKGASSAQQQQENKKVEEEKEDPNNQRGNHK